MSVLEAFPSIDERTNSLQRHFLVNLERLAGITEALHTEERV
jgi:hypothetical protein